MNILSKNMLINPKAAIMPPLNDGITYIGISYIGISYTGTIYTEELTYQYAAQDGMAGRLEWH